MQVLVQVWKEREIHRVWHWNSKLDMGIISLSQNVKIWGKEMDLVSCNKKHPVTLLSLREQRVKAMNTKSTTAFIFSVTTISVALGAEAFIHIVWFLYVGWFLTLWVSGFILQCQKSCVLLKGTGKQRLGWKLSENLGHGHPSFLQLIKKRRGKHAKLKSQTNTARCAWNSSIFGSGMTLLICACGYTNCCVSSVCFPWSPH